MITKNSEVEMETISAVQSMVGEEKPKYFHFDVFKGMKTDLGKIQKLRTMGEATCIEGRTTYRIKLLTLEELEYFLLPEKKNQYRDYSILRRKLVENGDRKYFWMTVGDAKLMSGANSGLLHLSWDFFSADDIYMNLRPKDRK